MTHKHFKAIADAIRWSSLNVDQKRHVALSIAKEMHQFNSHFDANKFISACTGIN